MIRFLPMYKNFNFVNRPMSSGKIEILFSVMSKNSKSLRSERLAGMDSKELDMSVSSFNLAILPKLSGKPVKRLFLMCNSRNRAR